VRLYGELADWYPLIVRPEDYAAEAAHLLRLIDAGVVGGADTLLELGCGPGHMASHLRARLKCTLTDLSPAMLDQSRALNPSCAHVEADMRTLRLGRTFDAVLAHDAIGYMTTEDDLAAAIETASVHLRPGGLAILVPDDVRDTYVPHDETGSFREGGRSLDYRERSLAVDAQTGTVPVAYEFTLRDETGERVERETHVFGLFDRDTWHRLIRAAALEPLDLDEGDPFPDDHTVFVARKVAA